MKVTDSLLAPNDWSNRLQRVRGFTLIELLAVMGCIGVLVALSVGGIQASMASAYKVREINAARNSVTALIATAADNDGHYLPGMDMRVSNENPVYKRDGTTVSNVRAGQRYPFRLSPYLGDRFEGTILVNKNIGQIQKMTGADYDYFVSAYPALGLNIFCVGGVMLSDGTIAYTSECISTSSRSKGTILAFASAGQGTGTAKTDGYCYISPPTMATDSPICQKWSSVASWKAGTNPMNYGFVDFRYAGKAVSAFLDGSVRMCSVEELSDMRLWNSNAAEQNSPNYSMAP